MTHPTRAARARRLAAQLENCWTDARAIGFHPVADAIEFARHLLVAAAAARLKVELTQPPRAGDLDAV